MNTGMEAPLSIVIVGASGDLAQTKILPALFALYCQDFMPARFKVFGFSRTQFTDDEFRARTSEHLTCRYASGRQCGDRVREFLDNCRYVSGSYDSFESFLDLYQVMRSAEQAPEVNRLFYLAIPPSVFLDVVKAMGNAGLVNCECDAPWSRVVIEKPFGRDRESSDELTTRITEVFTENQTFRIDHYLGKDVIQNLMVLRFGNLVFEPIWNRDYVNAVHIVWTENKGMGARGRYFDEYGIIRDVVQNHLTQILALIAMERPDANDAKTVRDEKIKVLKAVNPLRLENIVLGQYTAGNSKPGYRQEKSVRPDSMTATYAAATLHIDNSRWKGVPFKVTAGKGLERNVSEVRICFNEVTRNIFCDSPQCLPSNELVIRIQPDEAIFLRIVNKVPGLVHELAETELDLRYSEAFARRNIPDAYERLLLDVMHGDRSLFIRADELAAAWDVFTPVLHEIDEKSLEPEPYEFGSRGPASAGRQP